MIKQSSAQTQPSNCGGFRAFKKSLTVLTCTLLSGLALASQAQVLFSEDFESGNLNNWANTASASSLVIISSNNVTAGGTYAAKLTNSLSIMYHNLSPIMTADTAKLSFYMYDNTAATRIDMDARAYSTHAFTTDGTKLSNLYMIGKYNALTPAYVSGEGYDATKYQARISGGSPNGYFNLNNAGAPARATGWHRFDMERIATPVGTLLNYYVDNILARTVTNSSVVKWDDVTMGSIGAGSTIGDAYFDDIKVIQGEPYIYPALAGTTNFAGNSFNYPVTFVGNTTSLSYQWSKNGANLPAQTTDTLNFSNPQTADSGSYRVVITNDAGSVTSGIVNIVFNQATYIITQPASVILVNPGDSTSFTVQAASPNSLSYQWKKNGTALSNGGAVSGFDQPTLNLNSVSVSDAGTYTVVVSDGVTSAITSSNAVLEVNTPPTIAAITNGTATVGNFYSLQVNITDDYSVLATNFGSFENFANGISKALFGFPGLSGSTGSFVDTNVVDISVVTNSFPAGHASSKALHVQWSFTNTAANPWIRLTTATSGVTNTANPVINFLSSLRFDAWSDRDLGICLGVRESNPTGALASDGGASSAAIEWVGASGKTGTAPNTTHTLTASNWTTFDFNLPTETDSSFSGGDGILQSTTGKGLLEHLALVSPGGTNYGQFNLYLDNFVTVSTNNLLFTLDSGPDGAAIDPYTGVITWVPTASGPATFTVHATDSGGIVSSNQTFTITAAPPAPKITFSVSGSNLTLNWPDSYNLQSTTNLSQPWTNVGVTTSPYQTAVPTNHPAFYRLQGL